MGFGATKKRDDNERGIVDALRAMGAMVYRVEAGTFPENFGVPDLLVGYRGRTILLEVKNPEKTSHAHTKKGSGTKENASGKLTPRQVEWWSGWTGGEAHVVFTKEEACAIVAGVELPSGFAIAAGSYGVFISVDPEHAMSPAEADTLAGALHEQADVARARAKEVDSKLPK